MAGIETPESGKGGESVGRALGMRRAATASIERAGVRHVDGIVSNDLGWLFREQPLHDYGIDAQVEVVTDDDLVTGRLLGLQIKSGDSQFVEIKSDEGWVFRDRSDHLAYWLGHSLPVVIVIVDPGVTAYWQIISTRTVVETKRGFRITIPLSQPFDITARERLLELAGRPEGPLESLPKYYTKLPPDTVGPLRRAEQIDRLAAARLAERLVDGRASPGLTVASLAAGQPSWLTASEAVQDLWMAVGGYAVEHDQHREAGTVFELAADRPGPSSARARAFAGLSLLFIDRNEAARHLRRARAEGQTLLADVGLAALAVPENDARPLNIPQSMLDASDDELDAEPTVLNFLGEMATRRDDLNAAVDYRQRAVDRAGDSATGLRLALAETIRRRASAEGGSNHELRRALGHAQAAVEERRRWDGPSAAALAVLLDIQAATLGAVDAVRSALPSSEGGTARDVEATSHAVAHRGAFAALASHNRPAYDFFMQALADGPQRHELLALESTEIDEPPAGQIARWTAVLDEAADDAMAARCISQLVKLGVWPPQADDLQNRSILPHEVGETLRAIHRAKSGELDLGIAMLQVLADRYSLAAFELIQILEQDVDGESAIQECERQIRRWPDPALSVLLADLLRRHGHLDRAATLIEHSMADDSLPVDVRLSLCRWYVQHKAANREFAAAAFLAKSGLVIGNDTDLAWNLVATLQHDGKVTQARDALARHKPEPTSQQEIRLWMQLHLGVPLTPDDARIMTDIAHRQPDGQLRSAIIGHLVREVLLTPQRGNNPYPKSIIDGVQLLTEEVGHGPGPGLRLLKDNDAALREALEKDQVDPVAFQELIDEVRRGVSSVADVARTTRRPYGAALLQRPAGMLFATDLAEGLRAAGEQAAEAAVEAGTCVLDLSSLYLLNLLTDTDRLRLRSTLRELVVPVAAVDDAVQTRYDMRGLAIATYTASLRADGTIERTTLTPAQQALLRDQAAALESAAASLQARQTGGPGDAAVDAIVLAQNQRLPLWCDDAAMRQAARARGIPTFSLLDLVSTLIRRDVALDQRAILHTLADQYVVDLPLTADDIVALATGHNWEIGPAHTALVRPGWWRHHDNDWPDTWLHIATYARQHSADALVDITRAALAGALSHVTAGRRTQRYQQLVVLTLVACHQARHPSATGLLDALARNADPALPPRPPFVLAALINELIQRSIPDAVSCRTTTPAGRLPPITPQHCCTNSRPTDRTIRPVAAPARPGRTLDRASPPRPAAWLRTRATHERTDRSAPRLSGRLWAWQAGRSTASRRRQRVAVRPTGYPTSGFRCWPRSGWRTAWTARSCVTWPGLSRRDGVEARRMPDVRPHSATQSAATTTRTTRQPGAATGTGWPGPGMRWTTASPRMRPHNT